MDKQSLGKQGEVLAQEFLKKKGYQMVETNFRKRGGEIDLIARSPEGEYVFVEVKTRRGHEFGYPEEAVDTRKLHKIRLTAERWITLKKLGGVNVRIDVIAIEFKGGQPEIVHLENIS